jgi:hypothetical protein
MSLKAGNYRGFVYETGQKVVNIESAISTLQSDVVDASGVVVEFKAEFQDLSAQVQVLDASMALLEVEVADLSTNKQDVITDLSSNGFLTAGTNVTFNTVGSNITINSTGVGQIQTAFPINQVYNQLNVQYTPEGAGRLPWALTLSAGTYIFFFNPTIYIRNTNGDNPVWTSDNCNCSYLSYVLTDSIGLGLMYLEMSIYPDLAVGVERIEKKLGKQTTYIVLEEETTLGFHSTMYSPNNNVVVDLDPIYAFSVSNIQYVKIS